MNQQENRALPEKTPQTSAQHDTPRVADVGELVILKFKDNDFETESADYQAIWVEKEVATGMVVNFRHPEDTRIDVCYTRSSLIGDQWKEGYQRRIFSLTINNQCDFIQSAMDVKRVADAMGIDFGDRPTIVIQIERGSPLVNGYHLCAAAAKQLGWDMACPEWLVPEPSMFEIV